MKKVISILLTCLLIAGLAACGEAKNDDPNVGLWKAVSASMMGVDMEIGELFEGGVSLELKANGKFTIDVGGDKGSGKWEYSGSDIKMTASGVDMTATLTNGTLALENLLGMGMDIAFEKAGGYTGAAPAAPGASSKAGYYVLSWGSEGGETISGDDLRAMGMDYYVVLNEDGTAIFQTDNTVAGTWQDGVMTLTAEGVTEKLPYTIEGDELTIEADGLKMVFARSSAAPPVQAAGGAPPAANNLNALQQWWNGDWYGFIYLSTADGAWESLEDGMWDCFGTIESDATGAGSIYLWDDGGELADVAIQITEYGVGSAGVAMSERGSFNKMEMGHADWIIDPGTNTQPYEHLIIIDGTFEDPDGSEYGGFMYEIWLRPWGMLWDDAAEADLPPGYHGWYLERYMGPMPSMDALLSGAAPQPGASSTGNTGSTGGGASDNPLVGIWLAEGDGAGGTINKDYMYEFKADGTGVYTIFGDARPFTYKDDGKSIEIVLHPGTPDEMQDTYEYVLSGNTLKITTWIDEKVYTRQ